MSAFDSCPKCGKGGAATFDPPCSCRPVAPVTERCAKCDCEYIPDGMGERRCGCPRPVAPESWDEAPAMDFFTGAGLNAPTPAPERRGLDFTAAWKIGDDVGRTAPGTPPGGFHAAAFEAELQRQCAALVAQAVQEEQEKIKRRQVVALSKMLEADRALYERCLDTAGFAYWFNQLCTLEA